MKSLKSLVPLTLSGGFLLGSAAWAAPEAPQFELKDAINLFGEEFFTSGVSLAVHASEPEALVISIETQNTLQFTDVLTGGAGVQIVIGQFVNLQTLEVSGEPFGIIANPGGALETLDVDFNPVSGQYVVVASADGYSSSGVQVPLVALVNPGSSQAGERVPKVVAIDLESTEDYDDTALAVSTRNGNVLVVGERKFAGEGEGTVGYLLDSELNVLTPERTRLDTIQAVGDEDDPDVIYLPKRDLFFYITNTDEDNEPNTLKDRIVGMAVGAEPGPGDILVLGSQLPLTTDRKQGIAEGHPSAIENPFNGQIIGGFDYGNSSEGGDIFFVSLGEAPSYDATVVQESVPYLEATGNDPYNHRHPQIAVDSTRGVFALVHNAFGNPNGLENGIGVTFLGPDGQVLPGIREEGVFHAFLPTTDPFSPGSQTSISNSAGFYDIRYHGGTGTFYFAYADSASLTYLVPVQVTSSHLPPPSDVIIIISREAGSVKVEWGGQGSLERALSVDGPWEAVTDAENPYTAEMGEGNLFLRVRL